MANFWVLRPAPYWLTFDYKPVFKANLPLPIHVERTIPLHCVFRNYFELITFSQWSIKVLVGILFELFTPAKLTEIQRRISLSVELEFSWFSSSTFIETSAFKINHKMKIEIEISILIEKKVIFSHAYCGSSCSLHGITTHVKAPGFKQLNWRIHENLNQAIKNNGSWYKLSLLVSKDINAMIVPTTCIYSVWRFALNSRDMGPWCKHYYFGFYKLGIGKVIKRLNLSFAPLTTIPAKFSGILFQ